MEQTRFLLFVTAIYSFVQYPSLVSCLPAPTFTNIDTDTSALLALKTRITSDPNAVLAANWTTNAPVCLWTGVVCNTRHKRVASLVIRNMGIVGTLPPDLGNLSFLVILALENNSFHGNLPQEMARLRRLRVLSLGLNALSGSIKSWFGALTNLRILSLWNNSFTGSIPPSISNASKLEVLDLGYNHLEGAIPSEIGNFENLRFLQLDHNQLSGHVPRGTFNLSLEVVDLQSNSLLGDLPPDMCGHSPRLQTLSISDNNFGGNIPSSLFKCRKIDFLSLYNNAFDGGIPNEIGNLTALELLFLGENKLSGEVPQLASLVNLKYFNVERNFLNGQLPSSIFNLSSLVKLDVSENRLLGSLPWDMCHRLPLLERVSFVLNGFTGSFPSSIANCTFLTRISAAVNSFNGKLPSDIGNLPGIEEIGFGENNLSGLIPESIFNASKLRVLDLGYNSFSGLIPNNIDQLENIELLQLGQNNLTAKSNIFLTSLTKCLHLRELRLSGNPLQITLPDSIGNFRNLQVLQLGGMEAMGNIPVEIGNLSSSLIDLSLDSNYLNGTVPQTIGQLRMLQSLDLSNNQLQGQLPRSVCGLRDLAYLFLSSNQFVGSLPTCFGELTSLSKIQMGSNRFTKLSPSFWNFKDLLILNLSSNFLSGELPPEIGNLKVVNVVDLSRNQISGEIPSTIGSLKNLVNLSLAENTLTGPIPQSLGSLTSLEFLNLSHNKLTGVIPKSFEKLSHLQHLNLSTNELEGEIPQGGHFTNFTAQSFLQNKNLCGLPRFNVRPCSIARRHQSRERKVTILKYYMLPVFASALLLAFALLLVWMHWRKRSIKITDQENSISLIVPKRFSYLELQRATNGFAESNMLGKGGFSSVYKGTLSDESTMIAVKVFDLQVEGSLRSFDTECEVLRNARHRNLVKVIGSCSSLDYKALVIDYMPNGSLEKWLHEPEHERLNFLQRMNVMIDVASALEYLHHGYSTVIVHCDVKPSNILLDEDMTARLGDYGISKLFGEQEFSDRTKTLATIGYVSPEYGSEGMVSAKGDVYSYGITLLEIFTRRKPTDEMFDGDMSLKRWVMESLPHGVTNITDPVIFEVGEQSSVRESCLGSIMELALLCCAESAEERINIREVSNKLMKIKATFLGSITS